MTQLLLKYNSPKFARLAHIRMGVHAKIVQMIIFLLLSTVQLVVRLVSIAPRASGMFIVIINVGTDMEGIAKIVQIIDRVLMQA